MKYNTTKSCYAKLTTKEKKKLAERHFVRCKNYLKH